MEKGWVKHRNYANRQNVYTKRSSAKINRFPNRSKYLGGSSSRPLLFVSESMACNFDSGTQKMDIAPRSNFQMEKSV